jgi:hypothetical protein
MNFLQPADQFVYEEDPTTINVLAAKGRGYGLYRPPTGPGQFQNRMSNGPAPAAAVFVPRCWTALHALLPPAYLGGADGAVLFLHEMTSKNGARRLVVVTHAPSPDPQVFVLGFDVDAVVITPASGLTTPAAPLPMMYAIDVVIGLNQPPQKLRIYPGQIDPADPSHFTIRYEQWGQTDVMDGQLDSTGSRVEFTCRNHPSPRPRGAVSGGH